MKYKIEIFLKNKYKYDLKSPVHCNTCVFLMFKPKRNITIPAGLSH